MSNESLRFDNGIAYFANHTIKDVSLRTISIKIDVLKIKV